MAWLIREFRANLPGELDFRNEAKNAERTAAIFKNEPFVTTPKIYWEATSEHVLTMEFIEGVKINNLPKMKQMGFDIDQVVRLFVHTFCRQIFL